MLANPKTWDCPPRPAIPSGGDAEELEKVKKYGRRYWMVRWDQRAPDSQQRILRALSAFRTWRMRHRDEVLEMTNGTWSRQPRTP